MHQQVSKTNIIVKVMIVLILAIAVGAVLIIKQNRGVSEHPSNTNGTANNNGEAVSDTLPVPLPRLVDLGASKCVPCKMMMPILEDLKKEYQAKFEVIFIDVWKNPDKSKEYGIKLIPTQIFFDTNGKELFRHEGFFSKDDILSKWKELGFSLDSQQQTITEPAGEGL